LGVGRESAYPQKPDILDTPFIRREAPIPDIRRLLEAFPPVAISPPRSQRRSRWSTVGGSTGARMVAVDVAMAHRGPRDVAGMVDGRQPSGWSEQRAPRTGRLPERSDVTRAILVPCGVGAKLYSRLIAAWWRKWAGYSGWTAQAHVTPPFSQGSWGHRPGRLGSGIWCAPAIAHGSLAKIPAATASDATMHAASVNEQSSANFRYRQTSTALEFNAGLQPFHREWPSQRWIAV